MRTITTKLFVLVTIAAVAAFAASTHRGELAVPAGAQLWQYPLYPGPVSAAAKAALGLHVVESAVPWTGYNYYRDLRGGRWVLETLPAGTLVLVDGNGNPVYKADCGNRLVGIEKCPTCPVVVSKENASGSTSGGRERSGHAKAGSGFWSRHPSLGKFYDFLGTLVFWLLGLFLLLALLALLWWLLTSTVNAFRERNQLPPPPPPAPAPVVVPPVPVSPVPEPPEPAPEPPAAGRQPRYVAFYRGEGDQPHKVNFAGYRHVVMTDHGENKFTLHFRQ
jgi:hypothetical protein